MSSTLVHPAVVVQGLSFTWPDGRVAFRGLDAACGTGRTGLVGSNGSGKITLLRLVAGELRPDSGTVVATGRAALLRQDLPLRSEQSVADLLGVSAPSPTRPRSAGTPRSLPPAHGDARVWPDRTPGASRHR